ncbi:MAG: alpha/beta fold hydrolase [Bacteroidota bacterium]
MRYLILISTILFATTTAKSQDTATFIHTTGKVLEALRAGKYQEVVDLIDPEAKPRPDSSRIGSAWRNLQKSNGAFQGILDTTYQHQSTYDVVIFHCGFNTKKIDIKTVYGKNGLLKGVFFLPNSGRENYSLPFYCRTDSIEESAIEVVNGEIRLKGFLSVPRYQGKVPAIILVHGSGPNDKDESVGATKIFRDFACGFPGKGIAVLRYEKRTRAMASSLARSKAIITPEEETISDVVAAITTVKSDPRIDTTRIFLVAHSMGAFLTPKVLQRVSSVAGAVMLCPQARPLNQLLIEQSEYVVKNDTAATAEMKSILDSLKRESAKVDGLKAANRGDSVKVMGLHPAYWLYLRDYDAFTTAKSVKQPLLFIYGGRDYQVTSADESVWKAKLKGRPNTDFKNYPDLNHFFITGTGKSNPQEYLKAGNVEKKLIDEASGWILSGGNSK